VGGSNSGQLDVLVLLRVGSPLCEFRSKTPKDLTVDEAGTSK
jgi:hypothetical protein